MKSLFSQGGLFEVGLRTNVVTLTGANYHGIGMRFLQELDPLAVHLASEGNPDLDSMTKDSSPPVMSDAHGRYPIVKTGQTTVL
ncbi:MAG: hypothetical protein WCT12_01125 [Verrucomicrobiota bacterium]|jgi:hypothetical protein